MQSYKLSFTSAGLALSDSIKVAEVYQSTHDWVTTREILTENNILQSRTLARNKRVIRELTLRLSPLTQEQLDLLVEGSLEEQKLLLWFVVCKTYAFIREFATEVLHQKFLVMDKQVTSNDINIFLLRKLDEHPELEKITESTSKKLVSRVFQMLQEADLVNDNQQIIRVIPSRRIAIALRPEAAFAYKIYPAFPEEFELTL